MSSSLSHCTYFCPTATTPEIQANEAPHCLQPWRKSKQMCVCVCLSVCANKLVIYYRLYCACKYFAISLKNIVELFWHSEENTAAKCPSCFNGPEFHCLMVARTARLEESNQDSFNRGQIVNGIYIETPVGKAKEAQRRHYSKHNDDLLMSTHRPVNSTLVVICSVREWRWKPLVPNERLQHRTHSLKNFCRVLRAVFRHSAAQAAGSNGRDGTMA